MSIYYVLPLLFILSACGGGGGSSSSSSSTSSSSGSSSGGTTTILQGRSDGKGVDLVITGDGFTTADQATFNTAVDNYLTFHFGYNSVLTAQKKGWNVHRFNTVSPSSTLDGSTPYGAELGCFGVARLLCVDQTKVINAVAAEVPQYDQIVVLVNTIEYGGAGGTVATASLHASAKHVLIHELGHSYAGLTDEYVDVGSQVNFPFPTTEPVEPNATINNNLATVKWKHWLSDSNVGLFEGGRYWASNIWRPTMNSFMNELAQPFHPVNQEAWSLSQYALTGTHYSQTPITSAVSHSVGQELTFSLEPSIGATSQTVKWYVDNVLSPSNTFSITCCKAKAVNYTVKAEISDTTGAIKNDPTNKSLSTINWTVTVN